MKTIIINLALVGLVLVRAPMASAAENETAMGNPFHGLTHECKPEASDGPESTPQSPPLDVDDPSTPGCKTWEINIVADGDLSTSQKEWELPLLDINYGIGDNLQLKYEVPYANHQDAHSTISAVGESKAGVKYMFYENEGSHTQIAVYPQVSFVDSNSDAVKKDLATTGSITTLPLLVSQKIGETPKGDVTLSANLGYNFSAKADREDYVSAALGVGTPLGRRIAVMGEVSTEQDVKALPQESRQALVKANLGLMGTVNEKFLLFASVGHSLYSSDQEGHRYALAGFRVLTKGL